MIVQSRALTTRFRYSNLVLLSLIFALLTAVLFITAISQTDLLEDQQHVSHSIQPRSYKDLPQVQWTKLHASDMPGDFCHHPDKPVLGLEGFVPDGFELKQSHILVTPGEVTQSERAAMSSSQIFCSKSNDNNGEILNLDLKRDEKVGKMGWLYNYPRLKDEDLPFNTALSEVGIVRLVKLGNFFRGVYLRDLHLENSLSSPRHIKIYNTGNFLTQNSSSAILNGLLPKDSHKKIHTTSLMPSMCSKRWSQVNCHCPSLSVLEMKMKKFIYDAELIWMGDKSTFTSGYMHQIMSNLCSYSDIGCYVQNKSMFMNLIMQEANKYENLAKNDDFINFIHIYLYPFLQNLMNIFHHVDNVFEKFFMYFVDREFMFYLLNLFKFPVKTLPRPGSRVVLELYKKPGQLFQPYFVRILYNGADISRFIPLCHVKMEKGLCRLKNFANLLSWKSQGKDLKSAYKNVCSNGTFLFVNSKIFG